jgi:hypothetical protein
MEINSDFGDLLREFTTAGVRETSVKKEPGIVGPKTEGPDRRDAGCGNASWHARRDGRGIGNTPVTLAHIRVEGVA